MTSCTLMSALSALLPGVTLMTSAPLVLGKPRVLANSRVTAWMPTPIMPRETCPLDLSCSTVFIAMLIGIANETPM